MNIRLLSFKAIAIAIGLILGIVATEIIVRIVFSNDVLCPSWNVEAARLFQSGEDIFPIVNPQLSYTTDLLAPIPNVDTIGGNESGDFARYRSDENGFKNLLGTYTINETLDIFVVGDSYTAARAVNLEETWYHILGKHLGVVSYTGGVGGNGPYQSLAILEKYGIPKKPKVVVFSFYANDFVDTIRTGEACNSTYHTYISKELRDKVDCSMAKYGVGGELLNSYDVLKESIRQGSSKTLERREKQLEEKNHQFRLLELYKKYTSNDDDNDNDNDILNRYQNSDYFSELEKVLAVNAIQKASDLAKSASSEFVLMYIPNPRKLFGDDFGNREIIPKRILELREIARQLSVRFIDLREEFLKSKDPYRYFFYRSCVDDYGHFSFEGNEKAASILASYIKENKLLE